jgi:uncharacterized Zn-finger protein
MYETKRYDGKGNLIEVISAEKCLKKFWDNFGFGSEITEEQIEKNDQSHGMFHLITTVQRSRVKKTCEYCGTVFHPPRHKKAARYCTKPGILESQQCRRLAYREKHMKPEREIVCAYCDTPFMSNKANARFCAKSKCNSNNYKVRENAKGRVMGCHYCGSEFKASHTGNSKYCILPYFVSSLQCKALATAERKRDKLSQ